METNSNKSQERIDEVISNWKAPFNQDSMSTAKAKVLMRIEAKNAPVIELRSPLNRWLVAAAIAFLLTIPLALNFLGEQKIVNETSAYNHINLPDGSKMQLAPNAAVSYNGLLWKFKRHLSFDGEAFFEVVPGSAFVVNTDCGKVLVKGTSFAVWAGDERLLVHCATGAVQLICDAGVVDLGANELGHWQEGSPLVHKDMYHATEPLLPADPESLNKNGGLLNFESAPFYLVCAELEKVYGVKVYSQLEADVKYTGSLRLDRRNETFQVLCTTFGATLAESEGSVTFMP